MSNHGNIVLILDVTRNVSGEHIVSTYDLMRMVWGYGDAVSSGTIYTHVSWLRKKLKTPQHPGGYINTVRNIGYIFSESP